MARGSFDWLAATARAADRSTRGRPPGARSTTDPSTDAVAIRTAAHSPIATFSSQ